MVFLIDLSVQQPAAERVDVLVERPLQVDQAHCRGQYRQCSRAEISTRSSSVQGGQVATAMRITPLIASTDTPSGRLRVIDRNNIVAEGAGAVTPVLATDLDAIKQDVGLGLAYRRVVAEDVEPPQRHQAAGGQRSMVHICWMASQNSERSSALTPVFSAKWGVKKP